MSSSSLKLRYRPRYEARKHTNLCTVQRRLRHLTSIIGRNIDPNLVPSRRQTPKSNLLSLYFTIHDKENENITLYTSETIENTLNPNWKEFDSKVFKDYQSYLQTSCVIIYIWGARKSTNFRTIIRYDVTFSGLIYVKDHLRSHDESYESNSLLFGMFGGYYMSPSLLADVNERNIDTILSQNIQVEENNVQMSYKRTSLFRVHNSMKAIHETRQQVAQVKNAMGHLLSENEHRKQKCAQREALRFRNNLLRLELEKLKEKLLVEKNCAQREQEEITHRKEELNRRRDELTQCACEMKVNHSIHIGRREMLLKVLAHLNFRRRQLAAELSYIYPIIELPVKDDNKKDHTISGVQLPNSEDFVGKDESMLAVAIGNVAHLVYMMAKFMELPLRYPIRPMGSRSSVVDLVTDKLTDKQREFPLYLKGKEKFQFHYGVFLVNKNIAQLRYHNGLGTADLRNTLINLKHLLEVKYGVRIVIKKENAGFNKAVLMANRSVSLPHTSTSSPVRGHSVRLNFEIPDSDLPEYTISKEHSQSETLSGLPDVHVKMHQQHRFITRNSTTRVKKKTDSSVENDEPPASPDLLEVPFEDVVRRTIDGDFPHKKTGESEEDRQVGKSDKGGTIDCAEDCLNGNVCKGSYDNLVEGNDHCCSSSHSNNTMQSVQVSDALIIPDSLEREHDLSLSPSETIMV